MRSGTDVIDDAAQSCIYGLLPKGECRSLTIIYVMRHGEAEPKSVGRPDDQRHLTPEGKERVMRNLVLARESFGARVDHILSSPLVRAKETADLAKRIFVPMNLEVEPSLVPTGTPYEIYDAISKLDPAAHVLLVTHQPLVTRLIADLIGSERIEMATGSIAKIVQDGEHSTRSSVLEWLIR